MARAPRPGTAGRRPKRSGFRVRIRDETWTLRSSDIGAGDDFMVRRQLGRPLSQFLTGDGFGLDSVAVIVWMARRKAGETRLTWQRVLDEMPTFEEFDELTENDEFDLDVVDDLDKLPAGDVLELESEENSDDPLPSAGD